MGFRSTFTTEDLSVEWPQWFRDKYAGRIHFPPDNVGALHSVHEAKTYGIWSDLPSDIQSAVDWGNRRMTKLILVYLHECGGITRCEIAKDSIKWTEPTGWRLTNGVEHDYCYGCSDSARASEG